jgi:hypothetical protein
VWVEALSMVVVDLVDLKDLGDMLTWLCSLEDSVFCILVLFRLVVLQVRDRSVVAAQCMDRKCSMIIW